MAYGLKVWDASGTLRLSESNRLTRHIHSQYIDKDESSSVTLADYSDSTCFAAVFVSGTGSIGLIPHTITTSGTTISWAPAAGSGTFRANSRLVVFKYR